jgi:diguanylate cyclase (GGDEF)-like protein/PAS domain S-box-containing protein
MSRAPTGDTAVGEFAERWARAVAETSYVLMDLPEAQAYLVVLARQLFDAWESCPYDPEPARQVGAALVDGHFTNPDTINRTLAMLPQALIAGELDDFGTMSRIGAMQGVLAAGYAARLQERTLAEQDAIIAATVTARGEAERAARASQARLAAVFAGAAIGIGLGDANGNILDANPALTKMLGYSLDEMRRRNVGDFMHPDDARTVWELYQQLVIGSRESFQTAKQFRCSDDSTVWTHLTVSLIRNSSGEPEFQIAVIEDITDLRRLQVQLRHQADHDGLTGLANRTLFQRRLAQLIADPLTSRRVGLCLIDLDGFKAINDSVGHAVGDQVLVEVAGRLNAASERAGHLVARLGGDEFVILVDDTSGAQDVIAVAEAAFKAVEQPITIAGRAYSVTASAGIVERATTSTDTADLMRAADITLYWAKADGKNRWALFDDRRSNREVAQYTLARMLPDALRNEEFRLEYQPLYTLASGLPSGAEALLRWHHPKLGYLLPGRFIDAAEESGIIVPLGRWILETACAQARAWARRFADPLRISVNVAMRQLADPRFVETIVSLLEASELQPTQLQLELTERAVISTDGEPLALLRNLADLGVRIAIDDFGTGFSNMTYLRRLPVCELKLAGSFINEVRPGGDGHAVDAEIVGSLVSLAHTLGMTVTAEEVQTRAQVESLRALGCDTAQGNYFGPPSPPEVLQMLLDEHVPHRTDGGN